MAVTGPPQVAPTWFREPDAPEPVSALRHLRLLFWLRWKLTLRGFQKSRSIVFGVIFFALFFLPLAGGLGFGLGAVFVLSPLALAGNVLRATLLAIYLIWLVGPILGFQMNDAYDITRLFTFPISVRRLFVGGILGSTLDLMTLLLAPTLLAALVGFGRYGVFSALIASITLGLFLFHTLALSQSVVLLTAGILRSRKWRDFAIVFVPVFWIGYQVFFRVILPRYTKHVDWLHVLENPAWTVVNFLPPGCGARAITAAAQNSVLTALGYLILLGGYTALTVYVASWLIGKAYEGDEVGLRAPAPAPVTTTVASETGTALAPPRPSLASGLPPVMAAMVDKEVKYYTRDPYFRVVLMNSLYLLVIGVFFSAGNKRGHDAFTHAGGIWFATSMLLFQQTTLVYNQFGTDGAAAPVLFGFPSSRRQMILGKNLPLFIAFALENLVIGTALCFLMHAADLLAVIVPWMLLALGIMFAIGNLMSVYFPFRVVMKGFRTRQMSSSQGAGFTFLYLGITLLAMIIFAPAFAAVFVPYEWIGEGWLALTLPAAIAYTIGLYLLSLKLAESALLRREPEIMEKVYRAPE